MHEHVPSAYGTAGKLTDLRVDCSFSGRIWYRGLHGFQGFVHRDCCKDFCMYSRLQGLMHQTARTHACTDYEDSCIRLQGLMHVQTTRTHASDCKDSCIYRLRGLKHVQTTRTHACTDYEDSCMYRLQGLMHVQTARTHACTDCKDSCMYRLQGLMQ